MNWETPSTKEFPPRGLNAQGLAEPAHQTLTYYGFDRDEISAFAGRCAMFGLSRIVPVGQALNFDTVWDGYDLLRVLTRTIRLT